MNPVAHEVGRGMRGRDPAGSSGIFPGAHGVATMIIVKAARLDRRGAGATGLQGKNPGKKERP